MVKGNQFSSSGSFLYLFNISAISFLFSNAVLIPFTYFNFGYCLPCLINSGLIPTDSTESSNSDSKYAAYESCFVPNILGTFETGNPNDFFKISFFGILPGTFLRTS